jgi:hypothetical protein
MVFKEKDLVLVRLDGSDQKYNCWFRVIFIDNDNTFIGILERKDWHFNVYEKDEHVRLYCYLVLDVYKEGDNFCYSDNVSRCNCIGLCKDK